MDFLTVLAVSLLPAGGNFLGSLLAESVRTPKWLVGAALHAAAGISIALVSVELMPRILAETPTWIMVAAFLAGATVSVLLLRGVRGSGRADAEGGGGGWMVYIAITTDIASDGLMTGAASTIAAGLGLLLGLSQLVANIPGGFASAATFRHHGVGRAKRVGIALLAPVPVLISAGLGFWLLGGADASIQHAALAFMVGVLLLTTVEDVIPKGDEPNPPRWISTASFAGGFALFALLSGYSS